MTPTLDTSVRAEGQKVSDADNLIGLLSKVGLGDAAAFDKLYRITSPKLRAVALRILRDRAIAEDVLQDSYARIWSGARSFDSRRGSAHSWMAAIVRHKSIDTLRIHATSRRISDENLNNANEADPETPYTALSRFQQAKRLSFCLETLDPSKRQLVQLAYLEEISRSELSARFERPEGTIKTWLRRTLVRLKVCLNDENHGQI